MSQIVDNASGNIYLVTISKDNELFAIKKGLNRDIIFKGPFGDLKEFGIFVRFAWFIVYAIAFVCVRIILWWVSQVLNFDYPLFTEYILSYLTTNSIFSFLMYNIKAMSVQFSNVPFVVQTADDPDDAMLKTGDTLLQENDRNGGFNTF